jgi:hypothetical protein
MGEFENIYILIAILFFIQSMKHWQALLVHSNALFVVSG